MDGINTIFHPKHVEVRIDKQVGIIYDVTTKGAMLSNANTNYISLLSEYLKFNKSFLKEQ